MHHLFPMLYKVQKKSESTINPLCSHNSGCSRPCQVHLDGHPFIVLFRLHKFRKFNIREGFRLKKRMKSSRVQSKNNLETQGEVEEHNCMDFSPNYLQFFAKSWNKNKNCFKLEMFSTTVMMILSLWVNLNN